MPGYKTHDTIGFITSVSTSVGIAATGLMPFEYVIVYGAAVAVGTIWLSPDLDTDSIAHKRWGLLWWYWWPYKVLVAHRSWLSHSGPFSATLRLVYLFWPIVILIFTLPYLHIPPYELELWLYLWWPYVFVVWIGVSVADLVHTLADNIVTGVKRWR
jgi:uncharacterized metal-binding protein